MKKIKFLLTILAFLTPNISTAQEIYVGNDKQDFVNMGKQIEYLQFVNAKPLIKNTVSSILMLNTAIIKNYQKIISKPQNTISILKSNSKIPKIMAGGDGLLYHPFGGSITIKASSAGSYKIKLNAIEESYCETIRNYDFTNLVYFSANPCVFEFRISN